MKSYDPSFKMLFPLPSYLGAVAHRASCCPPLVGFQRCRRHCHWRSCRYRFRWRFRCRCRRSRALAGRRSHFCAGRCRRRRWTGCGGGAAAVAGRATSGAGGGQASRARARAPGDGTGISDSGSDSGWDSDSGAAAAGADAGAAAAADTAANWLRSRGCCARTAGGVPTFQTGCSSAAGGFLLLQLGLPWWPWCSWRCSWRQEALGWLSVGGLGLELKFKLMRRLMVVWLCVAAVARWHSKLAANRP